MATRRRVLRLAVARLLLILRALKYRSGLYPDCLVRKRERSLLTVSRKIGSIGARNTFQGALSQVKISPLSSKRLVCLTFCSK